MTKHRILAALFRAGVLASVSLPPAVYAQAGSSAPMVVKETPPKHVWLKAEVIHADANSIVVREQADSRRIHTFTYSPNIKDAMQQLADQGGYQNGDIVKILYEPGQTVALKIRGKPSNSQ